MGVAKDERSALCDLFEQTGPDARTLCAGWQTRDLAAHLVVRERRPDAAPGILLRPLAFHTKRVQDGYAARPWGELVGLIRSGPPRLSPMSIGAVDEAVNTTEYFVHHEDVRRAGPEWEPRPPDARRDAALWAALARSARMLLRRSPVGVVLRRTVTSTGASTGTPSGAPTGAQSGAPSGASTGAPSGAPSGADRPEITAKRGPDPVIISGDPGELLLFAFGRDAVRLDFDGEQSAIGAVQGIARGL